MGYPEFLNIRPYMSQNNGDPVMYGLYAVLVHSGYSCHAGHYYCYVKVSPGCSPAPLWAGLALLVGPCGCSAGVHGLGGPWSGPDPPPLSLRPATGSGIR